MIFTSRTYRVAIRRSISEETRWRACLDGRLRPVAELRRYWEDNLRTQINHTRRLQARKRKERK